MRISDWSSDVCSCDLDAVAEVTGRSRRIVEDGGGRQHVESRSRRTNLVETDAFMRGAKRILIFSDAGGTGRSYHASLDAANQSRRNQDRKSTRLNSSH